MKHIAYDVFYELYQDDQKKAFNMLYEHYSEPIYYLILRRVKNHDDTNDLLQQTFIKVWKNIGKFEGKSALYSWMYRIAINETNMFFRKKKPIAIEDEEQLIFESTLYGHFDLSPEKIDQLLFKAIETLPEKQRLIFEMRYFDETSFKDIVLQLGGSEGSHKASYHIARKKIEEFLKQQLNY